jgi:hypothetical protein
VRYHYILTLRHIRGIEDPAVAFTHTEGTYAPEPGETRKQVFMELFGQEAEKLQENPAAPGFGTIKPVVMFFSLEPDELETSGA